MNGFRSTERKLEPVKRRCICLPLVHTEENVCLFPSCQSSPDISVGVLELCPHESCASQQVQGPCCKTKQSKHKILGYSFVDRKLG